MKKLNSSDTAEKSAPAPLTYNLNCGITQSMLGTFLTCRHKAWMNLQGWTQSLPSGNFDFGNLIHALLEEYHTPSSPPACIFQANKSIARWHKEQQAAGPIDAEALESDETIAEVVMAQYQEQWALRDKNISFIALEQPFDVQWRVRWSGYRLRGKVDGILRFNKSPGKVWLWETKTKSQISEDAMEDCLQYDFQNLFYLTALKQLGYPVAGCVYNILRKPGLKRGKNEDLAAFSKRLRCDIENRRDHYFRRYELVYTPATVARFEEELENKLDDFIACIDGESLWYHNEGACIGRGNCPFIRHCASMSTVGFSQSRKLFEEIGDGTPLAPYKA